MAKATRHTLSTQSMLLQKVTLSRPGLLLVLVTRSCLTFCNPIYYSPPGLSAHGILQARIPEWVAFPSPGGLPNPGIKPMSPALQANSLLSQPPERGSYFTYHRSKNHWWNQMRRPGGYVPNKRMKWKNIKTPNEMEVSNSSEKKSFLKRVISMFINLKKTKEELSENVIILIIS